ncbi:MAG: DUF4760 domain-containing protein [Anaerolineales bacterium]|nr:DUF4760 domain-containing protein [Anaerolineales bacterium]
MELSNLIQIVSTLAMTLGIVFGILNLRNFQAMRKREAAILMLNSFQTMEFVRGLLYIFELPDGATSEDIESLPEEKYMAIYLVLGTWERLGILVHRKEIPIDLVDDAFSGPIIQSWDKLGNFVEAFRARVNRETGFEWFQWLAERMLEREKHGSAIPAYIAHKNWKAK